MKIIIFGATGGIGHHAVRHALEKGYEVVAYVRSPQKMKMEHPRLTIAKGVLTDYEAMRDAMRLLGGLFLWSRSFLLVRSLVELVGHEHHAVVLYAFAILPFLWLEVALDGDHGSLGETVEGVDALVLAPCLDVHEG